jgi:hypothetical protein
MKHSITLLFLVLCSLSMQAQFSQTFEYTESEAIIANPERGFYHHTEVHSANYSNLNEATLRGYLENEAITQILRVFYLEDFRNRPIAEDYLNNMRIDFERARRAGVKIIVRFAYARSTQAPYNDATPEVVFMHIQQLNGILYQNADVIAVVQAGFVGAWGEWYYTDHFAGVGGPSDLKQVHWDDRAKVIYNLMEIMPIDRMIQIRTPGYKMRIFGTENALTAEEAHSGSYIARLGHHNDCFAASSSDFGTYRDQDLEKPYLEQETTYTAMGGETCALASPYSDCENSTNELERFHWSYLNRDYNRDVLNEWDNQGCFDEVELRLGYRFVLNTATITTISKPDGAFNILLNLVNRGYSTPYNPRDVEIILKNTSNEAQYQLKMSEDPRFWPVGDDFTVEASGGLPTNMENGSYRAYLRLADPYPAIKHNPAYAIRLANENIWEPTLGYNDLGVEVNVNEANDVPDFSGTNYFKLTSAKINQNLPNKIYGGASSNQHMIFWSATDTMSRIVEQAIGDGPFEPLTLLDGKTPFFKILIISNEVPYSYRFKLSNQTFESGYSEPISIALTDDDIINLTIDGDDLDWKNVPPVASGIDANQNDYIIRTYFSGDKVHFFIYGSVSNFRIYLNTDNVSETGWSQSGILHGMDFRIEDTDIFSLSGGINTKISDINSIIKTEDKLEFSFDLSLLENIGTNPIIGFYAELNDEVSLGMNESLEAIRFYRSPLADLPDNFYAKNPINDKTSIDLFWDPCIFCDGYELERSADGVNFQNIATLDYAAKGTVDRGLMQDQRYYYRFRTFNQLGISKYSERLEVIAGYVPLSTIISQLDIYPNPASQWIIIGQSVEMIEFIDLSGKMLMKLEQPGSKIDVSKLKSGIYLVKGFRKGKVMAETRLIIQ